MQFCDPEEELLLRSAYEAVIFGLLIGKEGSGGLASMPPAVEISHSSMSSLQPWAGRFDEP